MTDWIKHDGKGMPVDGETLVQYQLRLEEFRPDNSRPDIASALRWSHLHTGTDIIAYRVHTPASEVSA